MAEVFGVVAGAIGLLHVSIKTARFVQGISEMEGEFQELSDEIKLINLLLDDAKVKTPSLTPITIFRINLCAKRLDEVAKGLGKIEESVKREMKDGTAKVKKTRWLIERDKLKDLLEKSRRAKVDFDSAIRREQSAQLDRMEYKFDYMMRTSDGLLQYTAHHEQMMSEGLKYLNNIAKEPPPSGLGPQGQQSRVEELPDDDETVPHEEGASQERLSKRQSQSSAADANEIGDQEVTTSPAAPNRGVMVSATLVQRMKPSCPKDCRCGCHRRSGLSQNTVPLNSLLGYMGVRFDMPSWGRQGDARCKCLGSWQVEYSPPWLRARVLMLSGFYHAGCPSVSLRAARIILWREKMWLDVTTSAPAVRYSIQQGAMFYPDDRTEAGQEILEHVIASERLDVLDLLLTYWSNVLSRQGLSKRAGWEASSKIQIKGTGLNEGELSLLQQVISFAEGVDEVMTSRVHEAARDGRGMAKALEEEKDGWAKDALDKTGNAPLHWAVMNNHAEAVQQLIQSGADVNITDRDGLTPFLVAAVYNRTTCMRLLLQAGCRIDLCSMDGSTALHWAAQCGSADVVRLLLDAKETKTRAKRMATATEPELGRLPLHELAFSLENGATPEAVEEIARLLLEAHPDGIESQDNSGVTPVLHAVRQGNLPLVRCLSRRGASWAAVSTRHGWALLHYAADDCTVATLDFLLQEAKCSEEKLHHIDHQLRDNENDSPWDVFIYSIYARPWLLRDLQHRDKDNRAAFVNFYRHVRDKNILHDINILQNALNAWPTNGAGTARDHLLRLAAHKAAAHNQDASNWYRGIANQFFSGDEDAAVEMIEQDLQDLNDELQSSPWHQPSHCDFMAEESQWVEFPNYSFWIEPAHSFVLQDGADGEHDNDEEGHIQQNDHLDDDPAFVSGGLSLDYAQITHIYSERGQLLYDHEKHHCGAMQLLKSYVGDTAIGKARFSRTLIERMVGADDDGDPEESESESGSDSGACTSGADESSGSDVETEAY